jgi:hypothetical protein
MVFDEVHAGPLYFFCLGVYARISEEYNNILFSNPLFDVQKETGTEPTHKEAFR